MPSTLLPNRLRAACLSILGAGLGAGVFLSATLSATPSIAQESCPCFTRKHIVGGCVPKGAFMRSNVRNRILVCKRGYSTTIYYTRGEVGARAWIAYRVNYSSGQPTCQMQSGNKPGINDIDGVRSQVFTVMTVKLSPAIQKICEAELKKGAIAFSVIKP